MTGDRFHTLFKSGRTLDLSYRRNALRALQKKVSENRKGLAKYMMEDLDTGKIESAFFYLSAVEMRIRSALYLTGTWMPKQHKKGKFPAAVFGKGKAYNEPVGVILLAPDPREPFFCPGSHFISHRFRRGTARSSGSPEGRVRRLHASWNLPTHPSRMISARS